MSKQTKAIADAVTTNDGGRMMVICTGGRLRGIAAHLPARLGGLTVETRDRSYLVFVDGPMPELDGLYWRVHVKRFAGRDVDFVLPVEGYCLNDLFEETGRQLQKLAPELVA